MVSHSLQEQYGMNGTLTRRNFLKWSMGGIASLSSTLVISKSPIAQVVPVSSNSQIGSIPPLYCVAYINPDLPNQANQEAVIARYPLTLVPQDMRVTHVRWRDHIKHLNSNISMLGYQQVITETSIPGPGHEVMRRVKDAWCAYPGGMTPRGSLGRSREDPRLFDPRKGEWQEAFLEACRTTLQSYPYAGLFLDNCTVFEMAHPVPAVKSEMRQALQATLLRLREEFPKVILIGNSSYNWKGLNGEMNESRPKKMIEELASFDGHALPAMDLYVSMLTDSNDVARVRREMVVAHSQGASYGACVDYQHVLWFDAFDEIMAKYR